MTADTGRGAIMILTKDLLFGVSIRNAVLRLGFTARMCKTPEALSEALLGASPALAIIDLSTVGADGDWDTVGEVAERQVPVLVFGPHKDVDGLRAAKAAGVTRVVSNGQFHREMTQLIERYATGGPHHTADVDEVDPLEDDTPDLLGSLPPGIDGFSPSDFGVTSSQR
jgi:DNA-binding NtrC family response regulator